MKNTRPKIILRLLLPAVVVGLGVFMYSGHSSLKSQSIVPQDTISANQRPTESSPTKEQNLDQPQASNAVAPTSVGGAGATQTKLVRFSNQAAKLDFLAQNELSNQALEHISELDAYEVRANIIKPVEGAKLFPNQAYRASLTPADPQYTNQWYLPKIGATTSWNNTVGTSGIKVAVIDTGFGLAHQDLTNQWAHNPGEEGNTAVEGATPNCTSRGLSLNKSCNNIDDDSDGYTDDSLGWSFVSNSNNVQSGQTDPINASASHATLVSGLIAAESNNNIGISGIAWGAKILPIQSLSDSGDGDTVSVSLGIHYAVDHGANIINLSLGAASADPLLEEQITYARDNGVVVVAAAGNDGCNCLSYPANYPSVIAVGASNSSDVRASFSSYGTNLALVAPGTSSICSTAWSESTPTSLYSCAYSGTSFSSPIVAGSAALLLMQNPSLTPSQVKSALTTTATKVAGMSGQNFTTTYGYGRLNTYEALKSVSLPTPRGNCTSYVTGAQCEIRAVNTLTNQVISFGITSFSNEAALYSASIPAGLPTGPWIVQMRVLLNGQSSLIEDRLPITRP